MASKVNKINGTMKELNAKRMQDIAAYVMGLNTPICNPNCKPIAKSNPIMVSSAYNELLDLQKEVEGVEIDITEIDIDRIFTRSYQNETEIFITQLQDGFTVAYGKVNYNRMKEIEELETVYPYQERVKRMNELTIEIDKKTNAQNKLTKVAPELAKKDNQVIDQMKNELASLNKLLDVPSKEEIRLDLYTNATSYLAHLKKMIDTKLDYLEELISQM